MRPRNIIGVIAATGAAVLIAGSPPDARAQAKPTLADRVEALEKKIGETSKSNIMDLGIQFHGILAVDYTYDFNTPDSGGPFLTLFDNEKNSFLLNLANLHIERQSEEGVGFVFDMDFGKTADIVNNTTFFGRSSGGVPITGNGTDFFDARQFYITYKAPIGDGLNLKVGRFVTLHGAEVIKNYNNFNYNISNGILFGWAIPFTHTGLMGTYAVSDQLSLDLGIVNGWDSVADNNAGKSVHGGINFVPDPHFTMYTSYMYGPEQTENGESKRFLSTTVFTVKATDELMFIAEYDYGNESNVSLVDPSGLGSNASATTSLYRAPGNADWMGAAGYIVYTMGDLMLTLRGEVFDDPDGVRTLVQEAGYGPGATYWEVTPSVQYKILDGLYWRGEYRHDEADKAVFPLNSIAVTGQDTVATELIYAF
jgi:hypothetical protein